MFLCTLDGRMDCIMNQIKQCLILGLLLLSMIFLFTISTTAETIWVDDDYNYPLESDGTLSKPYATIQAAINAAEDEDVIKILPGDYNEDIVIDKSVSLRTDSMEETIITSNEKKAYMVDVIASDVSIEGFTLIDETNTSHRKAVIHIGSGVQDVVISENYIPSTIISRSVLASQAEGVVIRDNIFNFSQGIQFENCLSCSITDNYIKNDNDSTTIRIIDSIGTVISNNIIKYAMHGVHVISSQSCNITSNEILDHTTNGIYMQDGNTHRIIENIIKYNGLNGIKLTASDSTVRFNEIRANLNGISIDSDRNTISNNTIKNNNNYGLYASPTSNNNIICGNDFTSSEDNILAFEEGSNQWFSGEKGNYWVDFLGPDNDEDGIGDIPYIHNGVNDQYPTGKFHKFPTVTSPDPKQLAEDVDLHPTLSVKVKDTEDERLDVSFYYILENKSYLIETLNNVESDTRASVAFYSTVQGQNAVYTYLGTGYDYIGVWYVNVTDTYSTVTSDSWVFSTKHVPVDNDPPTSVINCPDIAETDEPISFNALSCTDPDGKIAFYRWSFGDGANIINDKTPTHEYEKTGVYNVSLVVIDNNGSSASAIKQITISSQKNDPPNAQCNGPYFAKANAFLSFSSMGTTDPDVNDELSYEWSFGNGNTSSEQDPTYKYKKNGNYTVTLTVTDSSGVSDSSSTYAVITKQKEESTPGFEILLLVIALIMLIASKRKRKMY